jgi:hypothetical protein
VTATEPLDHVLPAASIVYAGVNQQHVRAALHTRDLIRQLGAQPRGREHRRSLRSASAPRKTKSAPSAWQERCTGLERSPLLWHFLAGLQPDDISATARAITAAAGVLGVFGYLALKQLPRPYLARQDLELQSDERGEVVVEPRAFERIAEAAARSNTGGQIQHRGDLRQRPLRRR